MSKLPHLTASEAEDRLQRAGFVYLRAKDSHRIYGKGDTRVVVPFHPGRVLHPKIVKSVLEAAGVLVE